MDKIIQKLENIVLPEEKDINHQYRLRRSLLNCSYFCESNWGIFFSQARFFFTSKHVVATVTISLVLVVGLSTKFMMGKTTPSNPANLPNTSVLAENVSDPVTAPEVSVPPVEPAIPSDVASTKIPVSMASDITRPESVPSGTIQFLTAEEMTSLLQKAFLNQDGTVMVDMGGKTYVFSFGNLTTSSNTSNTKSDFNMTTLNTTTSLTSQNGN